MDWDEFSRWEKVGSVVLFLAVSVGAPFMAYFLGFA